MQRAVALDPAFSIAWAGLNSVYVNGSFVEPSRAEEWRQKGAEALEHARELTPDAPHVLLQIGIREAQRGGNWLEAATIYDRLQKSYARYGMANQAWGPRGVFLLSVGRVRESIGALERARAEDPLAPAYAGFLGDAELANGNLAGALAEVDRGLALEGLETSLLGMGLLAALTTQDRAEIGRRLSAAEEASSGTQLNRTLAKFLDSPADAAAEIRSLAATASDSQKALLAEWAAFYREPELALELMAQAVPHLTLPSMLWQPLMRDSRRLPGFKDLVRDLGLVDYWRAYEWPDFCRPAGTADFICE